MAGQKPDFGLKLSIVTGATSGLGEAFANSTLPSRDGHGAERFTVHATDDRFRSGARVRKAEAKRIRKRFGVIAYGWKSRS